MRTFLSLLLMLCLSGCEFLVYGLPQLNPLPSMEYNIALASAKRGNAKAQARVGETLYFACHHPADALGWRPPCDKEESIKWNLAAAENGDSKSQYLIGEIYRHDEEYTNALTWLRKAAENGNEAARGELGRMYEYGMGVTQDWAEAYFWFSVSNTASTRYIEHVRSFLTAEQTVQVDKRVKEWIKKHPTAVTSKRNSSSPIKQ